MKERWEVFILRKIGKYTQTRRDAKFFPIQIKHFLSIVYPPVIQTINRNNLVNCCSFPLYGGPLGIIKNDTVMYNTKVAELKTVIGKSVSENLSPTGRAKLVKICKDYCIFESVQSEYSVKPAHLIGVRYNRPIPFAWNAYFF